MQRSYGIRVVETYDIKRHGADALLRVKQVVVDGVGTYQMANVWHSLCKKGMKVMSDEYYRVRLFPTRDNQNVMVFDFYSSSKTENTYVDEDAKAITKHGTLEIVLPTSHHHLLRDIHLHVWFGESEIRAEAVDHNGNTTEAVIKFH